MTRLASTLVCSGCGSSPKADDPYPFRCPRAGEGDVDHVLVRRLDPAMVQWPRAAENNPFLRYRSLLHSYHVAIAGGLSDEEYCQLVSDLDHRVGQVDGHGFRTTPFLRVDKLSQHLGLSEDGLWVKDETRNVSGSHKARHLMGIAIHLAVVERLGLTDRRQPPVLAIASCGNAALAAAVLARAACRRIEVFVPTDAPQTVVARLRQLDARVTVCERQPGVTGDPTYHRLQQAIANGALPFTCQGNENGLVVEGGETLGWEIVSQLQGASDRLDRIVVQVGGGALASSVLQAMREAVDMGALDRSPRIDTVQTSSAHPLERAYARVSDRIAAGESASEALHYAATHRSAFMWPWGKVPHSIAHGILDDETYDWFAVVSGMLQTRGIPVAVAEATLEEANLLARKTTAIDVDPTGSSGLAGLLWLQRDGSVDPSERVAVLFTGVHR